LAFAFVLVLALVLWIWSRPERGTTGQVRTNFRWLGPNDRIAVDGFDDPEAQGVACHISRLWPGESRARWRFADESRAEAELASAKTANVKANTVNDEMKRSTSTLIEEMQRHSGESQWAPTNWQKHWLLQL
jgi:catabolite regulation protein CreA